MSEPSPNPAIENEPQFHDSPLLPDTSEDRASRSLRKERHRSTNADRVEHTVWDEPALSTFPAGTPDDDQLTYSRWLEQNISSTPVWKSWGIVFPVALAAGPFGIIGALSAGPQNVLALMTVIVFGPITEEITKIAIALWVVEKRPFWFKSIIQIFICAAAGGWAFSAIENLVYTNIYIANPTTALEYWRWSVCVGLHIGCSLVAGVGLARIWDDAMRNRHRPRVMLGIPWFVTAMVGHGIYNASVTFAHEVGWLDFLDGSPK